MGKFYIKRQKTGFPIFQLKRVEVVQIWMMAPMTIKKNTVIEYDLIWHG
jgi:hypothetical protein